MSILEKPIDEEKRIEALKRYDILDTPPDGSFDRITKLASVIFGVPIAIITLVDTDRIWFKSAQGLSVTQIGRDPGLCASAILSTEIYMVEDASTDARTLANPLVSGEFGLKFYAAAPLQTHDQCNLGTLCIIDKVARVLTEKDQLILKQLADLVMEEMEVRLALRQTTATVKKLTSDIRHHLHDAMEGIVKLNGEEQKQKMLEHMDASRYFLQNIENQMNML